jgi:hypothetical protein
MLVQVGENINSYGVTFEIREVSDRLKDAGVN